MDPTINPFAPGAGTRPPELAGRDEVIAQARIAVERTRRLLPTKSSMLVGLRGVGKTVLLNRLREQAVGLHPDSPIETPQIEAPEQRSLPAMLAPQLRVTLLRLSKRERARELAGRALSALAGFARSLKVKYADIEVSFDAAPEPGLADNGDLEHDLWALLVAVGEAARAGGTAVVLFIDELQYVEEPQLAALITALHRTAQERLPVTMFGAGLPQLPGRLGRAKSYAERLFEFVTIGPLSRADAAIALERPAAEHGVSFDRSAVDAIIDQTQAYPYFLQEWGRQVWDTAPRSPITVDDVRRSTDITLAALDQSFFRVRFDRLTPSEKRYLRAMADLGPGPHRSGLVADRLGRAVTTLAPTRGQLIDKGMIWSPSHGDTAFTVPLFDEFMKRIMPESSWLTA